MQWILDNKEWIFSGIGVAALSAIVAFVYRRMRHRRAPSPPSAHVSGNQSPQIRARGDVTVSFFDSSHDPSLTHGRNSDKTTGGNLRGNEASNACWRGFRLGLTVAKLAWYQGEPLNHDVLKYLAMSLGAALNLPTSILSTILNTFAPASNDSGAIENATKNGVTAYKTLTLLLSNALGDKVEAAFKLGYQLINLLPQSDVLEASGARGIDLITRFNAQVKDLEEHAKLIGMEGVCMDSLRRIQSGRVNPSAIRPLLLSIAEAIDRSLQ